MEAYQHSLDREVLVDAFAKQVSPDPSCIQECFKLALS